MNKVVTRIPPSPTGHLHIGTARTALYNFLFARKHGGSFIMRSEDTDRSRSTRAFEDEIRDGLAWLGLTTDSFSRQSERGAVYRQHLERLIADGTAYISKEESKASPGAYVDVVRLKNRNTVITFDDIVRGEISFDTTELGDFVIARNLDDALYHFAVVVDDYEMGVTHVIRGEDHISNTPRQILIQEAIGAPRPIYAHLPLILAPDRSKMSKRHGAVALYEYRTKGYLPEALLNYFALLGWNPGTPDEIFTLPQLIELFDLTKIQKAGAIFDIEKLNWFNREHLKRAPETLFENALDAAAEERFHRTPTDRRTRRFLIAQLRERSTVLSDIAHEIGNGEYDYAFAAPTPPATLLQWKKDKTLHDTYVRLTETARLIEAAPDSENSEDWKMHIFPYAEKEGKGEVLWPLRVALSGKDRSPDPFSLLAFLGKEESLRRIATACATIQA